jgi:DNA-binding transcriptional regulator LsrR (DeoR family)
MIIWEWIVPAEVAQAQKEWEHCSRLWRANQAGATQRELGDRLGVSRQRISQLIAYGKTEAPVSKYARQALYPV